MRVIGLTGQTGAGKTTVSSVFKESGFEVINCDLLARQVVQAGKPCLKKLAAHFGGSIVLPNGELDRKLLGGIVFANDEKLALLNKIIFPYINAELNSRIKKLEEGHIKLVVLDAPTLFESGTDSLCSEIISVIAPKEVRRARIIARDSLTEPAADARMASQKCDDFYIKRSQYVLRNDGTVAEFTAKAAGLVKELERA
ncbi:MAG: dephospho-CoA kinase [Hydrogenoanaerobacterium sp.]